MKHLRLTLAIVAAALVVAVPAYAGGSSTLDNGYPSTPNNVAGTVATKKSSPTTPKTAVKSGGTLPFTGLDLGVFAGAGVVLVGTGFLFRRLGRQSR
jgi:hypothetical protein